MSLTAGKMEAQRSSVASRRPVEGSSQSPGEHPGAQEKRGTERDAKNPPALPRRFFFTTTAVRNKLCNASPALKLLSFGEHRKFLTRNSNDCSLWDVQSS